MSGSSAWPERDQAGPPPAWAGDVSLGVAAWVGAAERTSASDAGHDRELAPRRNRRSAAGRDGSASGREGSGSGRGSRRGAKKPKPPPPDLAMQPEADQEAVARKILLDQLTGQARSRQELSEKLLKRGVPVELGNRLLDRFEEVGLVDDEAFARQWIASRQPGKGLARRALQQELRRKGVDDEVAKEALDEIDPADEEEAARALVRKKLRSMRGLDNQVATRRLAGMLARKGYPPGVAFAVIRDELKADEMEFDGP